MKKLLTEKIAKFVFGGAILLSLGLFTAYGLMGPVEADKQVNDCDKECQYYRASELKAKDGVEKKGLRIEVNKLEERIRELDQQDAQLQAIIDDYLKVDFQ